jgi:hypothetical protein
MSTAKVEDAQPEPVLSTTQETTKMEEDTPATKIEDGDVKIESKDAKKNGTEKNGFRTYEDGVLKTSAREDHKDRSKNSKYDPSVLPDTDDPQLIRNQVTFRTSQGYPIFTNTVFKRSSSTLATATFRRTISCGMRPMVRTTCPSRSRRSALLAA